MEAGYPNEIESDLLPYIVSEDTPLDTLYPYVPIEVMDRIIKKHGGIDTENCFDRVEVLERARRKHGK